MSNIIAFKALEMVVIERVMCRGVDEPPSALRPKFWLIFYDGCGGESIEWDGPTYLGALEAAADYSASGIRIIDRVAGSGGDA